MMTRVTQAVVFLLALSGFKGVTGQVLTQGPIILVDNNNALQFQDGSGAQPVAVTTITLVKSVTSYKINVDTGAFIDCKIYESNDPDEGNCEGFTTDHVNRNDPAAASLTFALSVNTRLCVDCTGTQVLVTTGTGLKINFEDISDLDAGTTGIVQFYTDGQFKTKLGNSIALPDNGDSCVQFHLELTDDACHGNHYFFNFNCQDGSFVDMKFISDTPENGVDNCANSDPTGISNQDGAHEHEDTAECKVFFYKTCGVAAAHDGAVPVQLDNAKAGIETTAPLKTEHLTNTEVASIAAGGVVGVAVVATVVMYPPVWLLAWL